MGTYTFHVLGVPFTATSRAYLGDAMTQNLFNVCRLLTELGHCVIHYGNYGSDVLCTEHVEILTLQEMDSLYASGADVLTAPNGYYVKSSASLNAEFMKRAVSRIAERKEANQFLLGIRYPHAEATRTHTDLLYVQHSVGHMEPGPPTTIFASEYIRNLTLGVRLAQTQQIEIDVRSSVIPHFIFSRDFEPNDAPDDYFLFLGRLSPEKGLDIAIKVCASIGKRLVIAGQGDISTYGSLPALCEYVGYVSDPEQRKILIRNASALFMPSRYEAFGLAAIEALMSGVPLLTTDFGSFPEINQHGKRDSGAGHSGNSSLPRNEWATYHGNGAERSPKESSRAVPLNHACSTISIASWRFISVWMVRRSGFPGINCIKLPEADNAWTNDDGCSVIKRGVALAMK
jgi:hypothetical protein